MRRQKDKARCSLAAFNDLLFESLVDSTTHRPEAIDHRGGFFAFATFIGRPKRSMNPRAAVMS